MGGDKGYAKRNIGIPSSGIQKDFGDDGAAYNERRVGMYPSV